MSTRKAKQLIYGVFYALVLALIVYVVYSIVGLFIPKAPVVVPCTGNCEPVGASSITASPVWAFTSSPGHDTFLVRITNTNPGWAAQYFDYSINLEDASGTVLQSIPGSSFIYGAETKYLIAPNIAVQAPFTGAALALGNVYWAPGASLGTAPMFTAENVVATSTADTISVSGQITNTNISTFRYVFVDVVFMGANGNPVGASESEIDNVAPGQAVDFSVFYPQTGGINPVSGQIFVYGLK